jgi:N-methylhydantoinase A/oxoprolinase/acetone carboxylase beta subunit
MKTYASFFEWHDKGRKELGVVEEMLEALNAHSSRRLHSPQEFTPDPPDCICFTGSGEMVAIEVAEIVCEEATRLNAQGSAVVRNWRPGELSAHIAAQLLNKDSKKFHGGPYLEIIACLFTDEPMITTAHARAELESQVFGPFAQLTEAYLLFSYDPGSQSYPVIRLAMR